MADCSSLTDPVKIVDANVQIERALRLANEHGSRAYDPPSQAARPRACLAHATSRRVPRRTCARRTQPSSLPSSATRRCRSSTTVRRSAPCIPHSQLHRSRCLPRSQSSQARRARRTDRFTRSRPIRASSSRSPRQSSLSLPPRSAACTCSRELAHGCPQALAPRAMGRTPMMGDRVACTPSHTGPRLSLAHAHAVYPARGTRPAWALIA